MPRSGHGNRNKRAKPPWRKPDPKRRRKYQAAVKARRTSPGVMARHVEEANVQPILRGRIGTPVDEKMERAMAELTGIEQTTEVVLEEGL